MLTTSILLDLVVVALLVGNAVYYRRRGFLASLVSFVGMLAALALAYFAAQAAAPALFGALFRQRLVTATTEAIAQNGATSVLGVLNEVVPFLPEAAREAVAAGAANVGALSANMATTIVDSVIAPLVTPIVAAVLFILIFLLARVLLGLISRALRGANRLPVLGGANRLLGLITGILVGALYVLLILCVIWALDMGGSGFGQQYFGSSITYTLLGAQNIFLQ